MNSLPHTSKQEKFIQNFNRQCDQLDIKLMYYMNVSNKPPDAKYVPSEDFLYVRRILRDTKFDLFEAMSKITQFG